MIKVKIENIYGGKFGATFETMAEAKKWVESHTAKGKDSYKITTTEPKMDGAKTLEKKTGPMGMEVYVHEFPAEYEVEYIKLEEDYRESEKRFREIRAERDELLRNTDYTQLADAPMDSKTKKLYREYRDYLRRLPSLLDDKVVLKYNIKSFKEFVDGL